MRYLPLRHRISALIACGVLLLPSACSFGSSGSSSSASTASAATAVAASLIVISSGIESESSYTVYAGDDTSATTVDGLDEIGSVTATDLSSATSQMGGGGGGRTGQ